MRGNIQCITESEEELDPCPAKSIEHKHRCRRYFLRVLHHIDLSWYDLHNNMENKHQLYTLPYSFFCNVPRMSQFKKRPKFHRYDTVIGFEMLFVKFYSPFFSIYGTVIANGLCVWKHSDELIDYNICTCVPEMTKVRFISGRVQFVMTVFQLTYCFYQEYFDWFSIHLQSEKRTNQRTMRRAKKTPWKSKNLQWLSPDTYSSKKVL